MRIGWPWSNPVVANFYLATHEWPLQNRNFPVSWYTAMWTLFWDMSRVRTISSPLYSSTWLQMSWKEMSFQSIKWYVLATCHGMIDTTRKTCHRHLDIYVYPPADKWHPLTAVMISAASCKQVWRLLLLSYSTNTQKIESVPHSLLQIIFLF